MTSILKLSLPLVIALPVSYYTYACRRDYLKDPVMQRAMLHLKNDKRVLDFCGEDVRPGWIITKKELP